jgi:hypothetical protein
MKVSKANAQYQSHPKSAQRCDKCSMFRTPHDCTKVGGYIEPQGWSRYFEWKEQNNASGRFQETG